MSVTKEQAIEELKRRGIDVPATQPQPPSREEAVQELITRGKMTDKKSSDLPMIGEYEEMNRFFMDIPGVAKKGTIGEIGRSLAASFLVSVSSDEESAKIMESKFPGSKILKSEDGGTIFVSPEGKEYALDRPGIDPYDIARAATEVLGFSVAPGRSVLASGVQAGVKQAGIESAQESGGGDFEPGSVAASALGGSAGQYLSGVIGKGIASLKEGAEQLVKKGKELGSPILTSDVVDPEAASAITRFIARVADKYPGIGTAAERAQQRTVRNRIGEDLAREFSLTDDLEAIPGAVAKALEDIHVENVAKASKMRKEAINLTEDFGAVPVEKTLSNIKAQISDLERLGMGSDAPVIANLQDVLETIPKAENFADLAFVRTRIIRMIKEAKRGANPAFPAESASRLQQVKSALDKEMELFAKSISKEAGDKWKKSNKLFADEFSAYDKTILSKIVSEGDLAVDKLMKTLASTDTKSLKQLYNQMDEAARMNSKAALIQNALEKSGYYIDDFKPFKLANELNKPSMRVFFRGLEKNQLDGLGKYIRATKESMTAKDITPTGIGVAEIAMMPASVLGKMYQSETVRNMLIRLSKVSATSKKGKDLMGQIRNYIGSMSDEITGASAAGAPQVMEDSLQ